MKTNSWKKKVGPALLCGVLGAAISVAVLPVPTASAGVLGNVLGTAVQAAAASQQVDAMIKH